MILPGLVSVTFRALSPAEICRLCERAKLRCINFTEMNRSPSSTWDAASMALSSTLARMVTISLSSMGRSAKLLIWNIIVTPARLAA